MRKRLRRKKVYKNVEKYIRAELLKCELGEATIFNNGEYGPLACTGKYGASGPKAAIYVRDRIGDMAKFLMTRILITRLTLQLKEVEAIQLDK